MIIQIPGILCPQVVCHELSPIHCLRRGARRPDCARPRPDAGSGSGRVDDPERRGAPHVLPWLPREAADPGKGRRSGGTAWNTDSASPCVGPTSRSIAPAGARPCTYRVHRRLQIGVEVNPEVDEVGPLLTWFLLTEDERRPTLFLGTSSDRIDSPADEQSYFLTVAKRHPRWPVSAYASLNYSEWDADFNFPFGVEVELGSRFSLRPMYDGHRTHVMFNYLGRRYNASLLWVWLESLGVSFSTSY